MGFIDTTVLIIVLLLQPPGGQLQVIGPSQPIVATVGDDIILPCHLEPATDASNMRLEWARPDLIPGFVHVRAGGEECVRHQQPSYRGRTSVMEDKLKDGDVSLKLSSVTVDDEGTYRCLLPTLGQLALIGLVVGAVSSPVISSMNRTSSSVVLHCESKGWYPKPEVFWLDGEGNQLSAGATETVRGSDGLYTVSSRVTVEKRHSNSFTCRVHQKNINQTRETEIYVRVLSRYVKIILAPGLLAVCLCAGLAVRPQNRSYWMMTEDPRGRQSVKRVRNSEYISCLNLTNLQPLHNVSQHNPVMQHQVLLLPPPQHNPVMQHQVLLPPPPQHSPVMQHQVLPVPSTSAQPSDAASGAPVPSTSAQPCDAASGAPCPLHLSTGQ